MEIHHQLDQSFHIPNPILTIGTFDGVHLGHQKIISRLNEEAQKHQGSSVLFTFHPHPRMVLNPENHGLQLLQTQEEKMAKLERNGLDHTIIYPFTKDFAQTQASDFVTRFLIEKLGVHTIVVGYDHQFGKNREGSLEQLIELSGKHGFRVIEIPAHEIDEINISSTKIRQALLSGDIDTANKFLNEAYEISGIVEKGRQLGREIGFPTANLQLTDPNKLIPKHGVYAVRVKRKNGTAFDGMMNIGFKPSVSTEKKLSCEVHLLDFEGDLYDENISVSLLKRIRDEQRFENLQGLREQIAQDEGLIRSFFAASL
ncbi:MAG: bifunctional riboflavin kinase/FAD synthetase [Bacteroidetes bacterium]|nr:MAG: bifunctional riboflavin kinase/FAD synthetase [Bacteroidota bacterium]